MSKGLLYCGAMSFGQKVSGVTVLRYENGAAEKMGVYGTEINSQSILTKAGNFMISVSETRGSGKIVSYRILDDGALEPVNVVESDLGPLSYVSSTPDGKYAFVTCMGTGCLQMFRVEEDGALTLTHDLRMTGHSINPRQTNGKTHSSQISPDGRLIACANLGADELDLYRIDRENEKLVLLQAVPIDFGQLPRHMAFNPEGTMLYLDTESGCRIYAFAVVGDKLVEKATYNLMNDKVTDARIMASDIRISPDGKVVCAAVRGQNQIASFKVLESGLLDLAGNFDCGGDETRGLGFSKDGSVLFCANNDGTITEMSVDLTTGVLGEAKVIAEVPAAGSIMML